MELGGKWVWWFYSSVFMVLLFSKKNSHFTNEDTKYHGLVAQTQDLWKTSVHLKSHTPVTPYTGWAQTLRFQIYTKHHTDTMYCLVTNTHCRVHMYFQWKNSWLFKDFVKIKPTLDVKHLSLTLFILCTCSYHARLMRSSHHVAHKHFPAKFKMGKLFFPAEQAFCLLPSFSQNPA